jgi:putative membrane fusion protein
MGKTRKLNSAKIVFTVIVIAIFIICLIYNVIALFVHPSDTFMIDNGRISSSEEAKAYIIREEKLFQGENYKNGISQIKGEGQRVAKGDPIFRYYTNNEQNLINKISELDKQIQEAMEGEKNIYSSDIAVLEKQIDENLLLITKTNKLSEIKEYKKIIDNALTKKAKLVGELSPSGSYIKKLVSQRTKYEEKLNSGSEYVKATVSGIVSYKVDGLEEQLTPENIKNFDRAYLESLKLKTGEMISTSDEKGKIVNNYNCSLVAILNSDEAKNAKINDSVEIILSTGDTVKATINYISDQDNNSKLIEFKITKCIDKLIDYRKIQIEVIWWSASGLKVPNTAILREEDKAYIIRKRVGYTDKILVKVLKESKNYSIIENYTSLELKEMGYTVEEITNMKNISLFDEILLYAAK